MCVTLSKASMRKTIVYAGEAQRPQGTYVHVLGYQNQAENLAGQANAMILPFPSKAEMGPENVIDTSACPDIMTSMSKATAITGTRSARRNTSPVKVFQTGSYTVALAQRASQLAEAIAALPAGLRPNLNQDITQAYTRWYPDWPIAVCAWDGQIKATPLFWWYEPLNPKALFLPALDAHDGKVPNPRKDVQRDHALLIGSTIHPFGIPNPTDERLGGFLPPQVWGQVVEGLDFNGDYTVDIEHIRQIKNYQGSYTPSTRLDPKIWEIEFETYNPAA
jgi:hypothetical protein